MSAGILYGVGTGTGDMTLKAYHTIQEADVIAIPNEEREKSAAYQSIIKELPELAQDGAKQWLMLPMPMTKDKKAWYASHEAAADRLAALLSAGKRVAFLTIGDPAIYSTYMYIHRLIVEKGFQAELISGVPSFCAAAAAISQPLVLQEEQLHIIPGNYELAQALALSGTKVFLKIGARLGELRKLLPQDACVYVVENCGMENEKIYTGIKQIPDKTGYLSLAIVKEKR